VFSSEGGVSVRSESSGELVAEVTVFLSEPGGFLLNALDAPFKGLGGGPLSRGNLPV
jgi:hypothetical protein